MALGDVVLLWLVGSVLAYAATRLTMAANARL
jgi:hypothetical protein